MPQTYILGGGGPAVKVGLDEFFEYMQSLQGDNESASSVYKAVAWAYRCVQLRCNAVSAIPWEVVKGETEQTWPLNMEHLWWNTEAALLHFGAAYWLKQSNRVKLKGLQWLNPQTTKPIIDQKLGITGFKQTTSKGQPITYKPEEIVYFHYFNPDDDLGPGVAPMQVVAKAAGLAASANKWAAAFFEHGAIPAVILTTDSNPPDAELERIRNVWDQLTAGVKKAWRTVVLRGGMKPTIVGAPVKDLAMPELITTVRQQIAIAFGVPESLVGDPASNYATAQTNRLSFYQDTVIPEATQLESAVNEQLFEAMGLEWRWKTEQIEAVQQDEAVKAEGVVKLYEAGVMTLAEAREQMGLPELTPEQQEELQPSKPEPEPTPPPAPSPSGDGMVEAPQTEELQADFRRWRNKARKRGGPCEFESDVIPDGMATMVKGMIESAGVEPAFAFLKYVPEGMDSTATRLTETIAQRLNGHVDAIAQAVAGGEAPDYAALEQGLRADVQKELSQTAAEQAMREAAAIGIDMDPVVINQAALAWAREYSYEMVSGLMDTTRGLVGEVVSRFVSTPGMTVGEVTDLLAPAFGEVRAKNIGVTEITRAYAMGSAIYQKMLKEYGINMDRVWQTSADERVCPVCGPFNGKREDEWAGDFPDGPPAHPRCRCWTNLKFAGRAR